MLDTIRNTALSTVLISLGCAAALETATARPGQDVVEETPHIDVVIALDVSGSMSGLIESAKQRLWDIVNELGRAQPQPTLRLAILSFGRPAYGADTGYVKIDLPFTSDLDAVNETLFRFDTEGGDEYVARVVSASVDDLDWSDDPDALRIIFVAGNESATQDPQISLQQATLAAARAGIVVNTIYCGSDNDEIAGDWRRFADRTNGLYASIDQEAAAVANIATPMDEELAALNNALNDTYVMYGEAGERYRENQVAQDANAGAMSSAALASRVVAKAGELYDATNWDLVDAVEAGKDLEEIGTADLPAEMQSMNEAERKAYVDEQAQKREAIRVRIGDLDDARRSYIAEERARLAETAGQSLKDGLNDGLDEALVRGLRSLAEAKGFTFD